MNLQQQIEFDRAYRKNREKNMYYDIILYILYFITGILYILPILGEQVANSMLFIYVVFTALIVELYSNPLLVVKESGKNVNLFKKYRFTPIDMKAFTKSKQIIVIRHSIKLTICFEIMHLIGIAIDLKSVSSSILILPILAEAFMPIIIVSILTISKLLQIKYYSRKYS